MGIFNFFKKKKDTLPPTSSDSKNDISIRSNMLRIKSIDFYGGYRISTNGEYIVGFRRQGAGNSRYGQCVLLKNKGLLYQLDIERPGYASVSNNGMVSLNDSTFSEELCGTFFVIAPDGKKIIEHHTKANLLDCGISDDGEIAWCTTAGNPNNEEDRAKLMIFSISKHMLIFKVQAVYTPQKIDMKNDNILITFEHEIYRYDFNGNLLNSV
ncbi:MAG: hypothetical protein AB7S75_19155 [Desulfococcaceae bacterium]